MKNMVIVEIGEHEIVVRFRITSPAEFDHKVRCLKTAIPEARGDILRRCHVIPRSAFNDNASLTFCYTHFPADCVFVIIALPTAA
jgi:hypothetical protein